MTQSSSLDFGGGHTLCTVQVFQLFCVETILMRKSWGKSFKNTMVRAHPGTHTKKGKPHKTRPVYLMITSTLKYRGRKNHPSTCFRASSTRSGHNCENIDTNSAKGSQLVSVSFYWDHLHCHHVTLQPLRCPRWSPAPSGSTRYGGESRSPLLAIGLVRSLCLQAVEGGFAVSLCSIAHTSWSFDS